MLNIDIPYAAASGVVSVARLVPFMTEKMLTRFNSLTFTPESAIIAAFPFNTGSDYGNIARFARFADYHEAIYAYLQQAVDGKHGFHALKNGWPLPLVPAARLAGVGFTGRHGLQIVEPYGSYVALGAILSEEQLGETPATGGCLACGACERACPTGAMRFDGDRRVLIRDLCISSITQAKDPERLDLLSKSHYAWGCDICQEACPQNAAAALTEIPEFTRAVISGFTHETPALADRHYSGREALLRRNLEYVTTAKQTVNTAKIASVTQTFSTTPV